MADPMGRVAPPVLLPANRASADKATALSIGHPRRGACSDTLNSTFNPTLKTRGPPNGSVQKEVQMTVTELRCRTCKGTGVLHPDLKCGTCDSGQGLGGRKNCVICQCWDCYGQGTMAASKERRDRLMAMLLDTPFETVSDLEATALALKDRLL